MKSILIGVTAALVVNFLAIAGFGGWLYATDRINRDRLDRSVELFSPTIQEETAAAELAAQANAEAEKVLEHNAYLEAVSEGRLTLNDRLRANTMAREIATQRVNKLQREIDDLKSHLDIVKAELTERKAELDAQKADFKRKIEEEVAQRSDENFLNAVQMYEQLKPRQAKQLFQAMLAEVAIAEREAAAAETYRIRDQHLAVARKKNKQIIDYLSAMQQRKAAAMLREFKSPEEIVQAQTLIQALRDRANDIDPRENPAPLNSRLTPPRNSLATIGVFA